MPVSLADAGRLGGLTRADRQTPEQCHELARKGHLASAVKAIVDRAPELSEDQKAPIRATP
jgi:hypothetical protein